MLAVFFLLASGSVALAKIQFCNNFEHPIFVALAFQQNGEWITEGWLEVDVDKCVIDAKHADVTSFEYIRQETVELGQGQGIQRQG